MNSKTDIGDLYMKVFHNKIEMMEIVTEEESKTLLKQLVFLGVKFIINDKREKTDDFYYIVWTISDLMALLTPKDFMTIFPISKEYDGEKYECKDYFYTIKYINTLDINKPIGEDEIYSFLWEYVNRDTNMYTVNLINAIDHIRAKEGKESIVEKFAHDNGIDTYTVNEELGYIYNNRTKKTKPLNKKPPYIRIIK